MIDKRSSYYINYHIEKKSPDYRGFVPMTIVFFFGEKKEFENKITRTKHKMIDPLNTVIAVQSVKKTETTTLDVINPEKPWLKSDTTADGKTVDGVLIRMCLYQALQS